MSNRVKQIDMGQPILYPKCDAPMKFQFDPEIYHSSCRGDSVGILQSWLRHKRELWEKYGWWSQDRYYCRYCERSETIHIRVCKRCGGMFAMMNARRNSICRQCSPQGRRMRFPKTPKEILRPILQSEDDIRRKYQEQNYLVLGDGIAGQEVRDMFEFVGDVSSELAEDRISEYLAIKDGRVPIRKRESK